MLKKKNKTRKVKMELSNEIFQLGISLALSPLNFILRKLNYYSAIATSIVTIFVWSTPVIIMFSLVANTIFVFEILFKLLRK